MSQNGAPDAFVNFEVLKIDEELSDRKKTMRRKPGVAMHMDSPRMERTERRRGCELEDVRGYTGRLSQTNTKTEERKHNW